MRKTRSLSLILAVASIAAAQTSISGNLGGMTLDPNGNPFIVEKEITVPKGKTLTIKEGTILLFKPFTGLTVYGNCSVLGSPANPVVFTSINDSVFNKMSTQEVSAFDWNGIVVGRESGDVLFKYVNVRYATNGIKSQNPDIMIQQGVFKENGQFHLRINDKIEPVEDNEPFSFNENKKIDTPAAAAPAKPAQRRTIKIVRYSLLGAGAAAGVAGIILSTDASGKYSHWKDIETETDPLPPRGEYEKRQKAFNAAFAGAIITDIISGLGLAGFGVTFLF